MRCRCAAKSLGKLVLCPIHTARLDRLVALRRAAQIESAMREFWTLPTARTICHLPDYPYWLHKRRNHTPQNSNKAVLSLVTRLPGPRSAANQPHTPQPLSIDGTDRQTDGRTSDRYIDRAPQTLRAALMRIGEPAEQSLKASEITERNN